MTDFFSPNRRRESFAKLVRSGRLGNADRNVGGNVVAKLAPDGTPLLVNAIPGSEAGDPHRRTDYRVHHVPRVRRNYENQNIQVNLRFQSVVIVILQKNRKMGLF